MEACQESREVKVIKEKLYDLISAHSDLLDEETSDSTSEETKNEALKNCQQEIINLSYKLKEACDAYRRRIKTKKHINDTNGLLVPVKTYAQTNGTQSAAINGTENSTEDHSKKNSILEIGGAPQPQKVPMQILKPNMVLHPSNGNVGNLKLSESKPTVFIIKVPQNTTGPFNIVSVQPSHATNMISAALPVNGIVVNNVAPLANITTIKNNEQIPTLNKIVSVPSPMITQALAVAATKGLQMKFAEDNAESSSDEGSFNETMKKDKPSFLAYFGLITHEKHIQLTRRRNQRRRRRTANPKFSTEAVEERKRLDLARKKRRIVIPKEKTSTEFKDFLESEYKELQAQTAELAEKHKVLTRCLTHERSRAAFLAEQQCKVESMIARLRDAFNHFTDGFERKIPCSMENHTSPV